MQKPTRNNYAQPKRNEHHLNPWTHPCFMKATILLAMAMRAAADRSRSYAVLSSTRNDAADVTWLRNPKTATTAFVYGVMPLKPCGDRLRVSEKHEVGCARQACGDGDADALRGIAADQRDAAAAAAASNAIVTLREPVARFRSAWTFLRAKHPNATAWRRYGCVADLARALGAFDGLRSVKGRVDAVAKVLAEKRSYKPFALWPQAYWYNPLLGPRNGSAVVVCYDGAAFLRRTTDALAAVFGCDVGAAANVSFTANTKATALKAAPAAACAETPAEAAATDAALRRFYADDARAWDAYCKLP